MDNKELIEGIFGSQPPPTGTAYRPNGMASPENAHAAVAQPAKRPEDD
jgi:hypothetical protein